MKKIIFGIILTVLVFSILFAACDANKIGDNPTEKNQTTTESAKTESETTSENIATGLETKPTDSENHASELKVFRDSLLKLSAKQVQSQNIQNINIYNALICRYGDYIIYFDENYLYCKKTTDYERITILSNPSTIIGLIPIDGQNICIRVLNSSRDTELYQYNLIDGTMKKLDASLFGKENATLLDIMWVNNHIVGSVAMDHARDYYIKLPSGKFEKIENTWGAWVVGNDLYYQLTEDFFNLYKCDLDGNNRRKYFTSEDTMVHISEYIVTYELLWNENGKLAEDINFIFTEIKTIKEYVVSINSEVFSSSTSAEFIFDENVAYGLFSSTNQVAKIDITKNTYSIISKDLKVEKFSQAGNALYFLTTQNELFSINIDGSDLKKF